MSAVRRLAPLALCALLATACAEDAEMDDMEMEGMEEADMSASALADYAGTWDAVAILESGDTVEYSMTATADTTGWMIDLPDREPMPLRVVSVAGDSVVTEVGPYQSILREGVMVTTRSVTRLQGDAMMGTLEARYQGGEGETVVRGQVTAHRGM